MAVWKAQLRLKPVPMHRRQAFRFDLSSEFCYYKSTVSGPVARQFENISNIVVWGGNEEQGADRLLGK